MEIADYRDKNNHFVNLVEGVGVPEYRAVFDTAGGKHDICVHCGVWRGRHAKQCTPATTYPRTFYETKAKTEPKKKTPTYPFNAAKPRI